MANRRTLAVPAAAALAAAAAAFSVVYFSGDDDNEPARTAAPAESARPQAVAEGRKVFVAMGCGGCHTLKAAGSEAQIGPNLDITLGSYTREALKAKITNPGAGSMMPEDFGTRMTPRELDDLASFLLAAAKD